MNSRLTDRSPRKNMSDSTMLSERLIGATTKAPMESTVPSARETSVKRRLQKKPPSLFTVSYAYIVTKPYSDGSFEAVMVSDTIRDLPEGRAYVHERDNLVTISLPDKTITIPHE